MFFTNYCKEYALVLSYTKEKRKASDIQKKGDNRQFFLKTGEIRMRVAIIGCGSIAKVHADVINKMPNVTLVSLADCRIERAAEYARIYGGEHTHSYSSYEEMITMEKPDVIHICTPHYLHVPMALYGLTHGCNVFMEKPPAISREQFLLLEKASTTKYCGFCFQNRYNESTKLVKELLKKKENGNVLGARAFVTWCRNKNYYTESGWRGSWAMEGGGALINQAIHTLDLLVQFLGKPLKAEASMRQHHLRGIIEVEDSLEAYIQFPSSTACFYATTAYCKDAPIFIEIECENVTIRLEGSDVSCLYPNGRKEDYRYQPGITVGKSYWGVGHKACIEDFYYSIRENIPYQNNLASVKDTFSLMMDIYESGRLNENC